MAINWQKFDKEEKVILDKGYGTECFVFVEFQTTNRMFSHVRSEISDSSWDVMTNRLTKIKIEND